MSIFRRFAPIALVLTSAGGTAMATVPASSGEGGCIFVQVAVRNDHAAAMTVAADLQQKYAKVLGRYPSSLCRVDAGEKGFYFRVFVGPMVNMGEADKLCAELKGAGMRGCFSRAESSSSCCAKLRK